MSIWSGLNASAIQFVRPKASAHGWFPFRTETLICEDIGSHFRHSSTLLATTVEYYNNFLSTLLAKVIILKPHPFFAFFLMLSLLYQRVPSFLYS